MSLTLKRIRQRAAHYAFEGRYAIHTSGRTDLDDYGLFRDDRVYYIPANWMTLRRSLRRRDISQDDVFVDLGSGKGRMVLEAARYPFGRVIGVELAQPLHEAALENLRTSRMHRACERVELVCADVSDYEVPDDVTFVFLNNPFRGGTFTATIDKLIASYDRSPRKIRLIYDNPTEHEALMRTGRFTHDRVIYRGVLHHASSTAFDRTSLYTMTPARR